MIYRSIRWATTTLGRGFKSRAEREALLEDLVQVNAGWGTRSSLGRNHCSGLEICAPSLADDPRAVDWYTALLLLSTSPSGAVAFHHLYFETDAQPILASLRVPTLSTVRATCWNRSMSHGSWPT